MAKINPYLNFKGTTEEAFNFYKSVFGGEFTMLQRFKDTPQAGNVTVGEQEKIMHIALPIGENILMGTDELVSMGHTTTPGNNFSLTVDVGSKEEAEKIFNGLSEGGKIEMPLADAFWGAYFGMLEDKFGVRWMVNYAYPKK